MTRNEESEGELSGAQKRALRALGHSLHPIVLVGNRGVTEGLIENLDNALTAHELVKVKVHDAGSIEGVVAGLHVATQSHVVGRLGKTVLFYRRHPKDPQIVLPSK